MTRTETQAQRDERLRQQWAECQANFRPVLAEMEAEGFRAIADYQGHKPYRLRAFDGDKLVGLVYLGSKCQPMTDWHRRLDEAEAERQREQEVDQQLADREAPAEDELLAHQGYTRQDELALIAHHEEMDREQELEQQHGGRRRCEECDQFEVEARTVSTGCDQSEFTRCRNCGHETFAG